MSEDVNMLRLQNNIPGVTDEAAKVVERMLRDGRRYFGSSGASLTWQAFAPVDLNEANEGINPTLAKVGLEGERSTTAIIREWMADKPNAVLIDSVHIDTSFKDKNDNIHEEDLEETLDEESGIIDGKDTDHVLIIGNQVILIDTKRWKSKRTYSLSENGKVLRTKKPFPGGSVKMRSAVFLWLEYLLPGAAITGVVHVNAEETKVLRNRNWFTQNFRVVELNRFIEYLDSRWKEFSEEDKTTINPNLVAQVAVCAIKPFDPYTKVFNEESLRAFRGK